MKSFFNGLALLLVFIICILFWVHQLEGQEKYIDISIYSVLMFTVLSIILQLLLRKSVYSPNKQLFISITLANMLLKIVFSALLLLLYKKLTLPLDTKFIIPFLIVYLGFTIFETWFMVRLSDGKS